MNALPHDGILHIHAVDAHVNGYRMRQALHLIEKPPDDSGTRHTAVPLRARLGRQLKPLAGRGRNVRWVKRDDVERPCNPGEEISLDDINLRLVMHDCLPRQAEDCRVDVSGERLATEMSPQV